jgi:hypothetical protein
MRRKQKLQQGNRDRKLATERFIDLTDQPSTITSAARRNQLRNQLSENQPLKPRDTNLFSDRSLQVIVDPEFTDENSIENVDAQETSLHRTSNVKTVAYQTHVETVPYQQQLTSSPSFNRYV